MAGALGECAQISLLAIARLIVRGDAAVDCNLSQLNPLWKSGCGSTANTGDFNCAAGHQGHKRALDSLGRTPLPRRSQISAWKCRMPRFVQFSQAATFLEARRMAVLFDPTARGRPHSTAARRGVVPSLTCCSLGEFGVIDEASGRPKPLTTQACASISPCCSD